MKPETAMRQTKWLVIKPLPYTYTERCPSSAEPAPTAER